VHARRLQLVPCVSRTIPLTSCHLDSRHDLADRSAIDQPVIMASHANTYWRLITDTQAWSLESRRGFTVEEKWKRMDAASERLEQLKYPVPANATLGLLLGLLRRALRGNVPYASCSLDELQIFMQQRSMKVPSGKLLTHARLIRALEKADDVQTFEKMLDLPPELRVLIFEIYFEDLREELATQQEIPFRHAQPPITMVSRLFRQESLGLFYDVSNFVLRYSHDKGVGAWPRLEVKPMPPPTSNLAWRSTVNRIKQLHILVQGSDRSSFNERRWCLQICVLFLKGRTGLGVAVVGGRLGGGKAMTLTEIVQTGRRTCSSQFFGFLRDMAESDSGVEWSEQRLERLRPIFWGMTQKGGLLEY